MTQSSKYHGDVTRPPEIIEKAVAHMNKHWPDFMNGVAMGRYGLNAHHGPYRGDRDPSYEFVSFHSPKGKDGPYSLIVLHGLRVEEEAEAIRRQAEENAQSSWLKRLFDFWQ